MQCTFELKPLLSRYRVRFFFFHNTYIFSVTQRKNPLQPSPWKPQTTPISPSTAAGTPQQNTSGHPSSPRPNFASAPLVYLTLPPPALPAPRPKAKYPISNYPPLPNPPNASPTQPSSPNLSVKGASPEISMPTSPPCKEARTWPSALSSKKNCTSSRDTSDG